MVGNEGLVGDVKTENGGFPECFDIPYQPLTFISCDNAF